MSTFALFMFVPLLAAQDEAIVEGIAFNRATGAKVPGVVIKLAPVSAASNVLYTVRSDAAGAFRIEGVKGGDYVPSFEAPDGFRAPAFWEPPSKPFHIGGNNRAVKLEIPMRPLVTLQVRVVDGEGHPVPNVRVECFLTVGGGGVIGNTDSEGRSSLAGLLAGAYKLRARPVLPGTPLAQRSKEISALSIRPSEGERWAWAPTYFPDTVELAAAETLIVAEGAKPPEYEIMLRAAPVHCLRGVVSDDEGRPVSGASVSLLSEIGWGAAEAKVASSTDGSFEFPSVRPGEWQVVATAKRGEVVLKGFTQLVMPRRDLEGVLLQIAQPFALDVVFEGLPRDRKGPLVWLFPEAGPDEQVAHAGPQPDGTTRFEEVYAGRYRLGQPGALSGYYLKSIELGSADITGKVVDLTQQSPPVKLVFSSKPARAWGRVENGAGIKVVLVDAAQEDYILGQEVRIAVCDDQGRFAIEDLRPGTYHAFAFAMAGVNTGAVKEAVLRLGLSQQARTVRLGEGEAVKLDLKITPFPASLGRP